MKLGKSSSLSFKSFKLNVSYEKKPIAELVSWKASPEEHSVNAALKVIIN